MLYAGDSAEHKDVGCLHYIFLSNSQLRFSSPHSAKGYATPCGRFPHRVEQTIWVFAFLRSYWLPKDGYSYETPTQDRPTDLVLNSFNPPETLSAAHHFKSQFMRSKVYRATPRFGSSDSEQGSANRCGFFPPRGEQTIWFDVILRSHWLPKDIVTNKKPILIDPTDLFLNLVTPSKPLCSALSAQQCISVPMSIEQHRDLAAPTASKRLQNCPGKQGGSYFLCLSERRTSTCWEWSSSKGRPLKNHTLIF